VPFPHVGCSAIGTKFCLRPPAASFSMGSRISSPPDLADRAILLMLAPIAETATTAGACALAGVRARPPAHPWRAPRCGRAWVTHAAAGTPQAVAAHGRRERISTRGTLETAYANNRRATIENIIDADPVAALVREIIADRAQWRGSASDLLQVGTNRSGWTKSSRALAGRLRRAHTFLRTLGIE
jgi:hypothetical protein